MKKWTKLLVGMSAILGTLLLAAGCSGGNSSSGSNKVTVSMYQPGDKPKNYNEMIKAANARIHKTLPNVDLDLKFIGWGDWGKKYNVMVTSGDPYDISFASDYVSNAQKGAYADLTDLMQKYAKKAYAQIDPAYIKGNTVKGKLYAFPVNANVYAANVLTFNMDLVNKYNLDISKVKSYADLTPIFEKFHKEAPNIAAFAIGQNYKASMKAVEYPATNSLPFAVYEDGKDSKIFNRYDSPEMQKTLTMFHDWYQKGYIPRDAATSTTGYNFQKTLGWCKSRPKGRSTTAIRS